MRALFLLTILSVASLGQSIDQGRAFYKEGKVADARKTFEAILYKNSNDAEARYWLAVVCIHRDIRDWDTAVDNIEAAVESDPNRADFQYILGATYGLKAQNSGIFKQAILAPRIKKAFQKAVDPIPGGNPCRARRPYSRLCHRPRNNGH